MVSIKRFLTLIVLIVLLAMVTPSAFCADEKIITYYFHGNARCSTCHKMEEYAKEAIEENFKDKLASGLLIFQTVNIDEKENEHFIAEYALYTKALIVSRVGNGKEIEHKNLTKIWEYVRNKKKFFAYVTTEINAYLQDSR